MTIGVRPLSNVQVALAVGWKEILEHFRTRRIFWIGGVFAATFLLTSIAAVGFLPKPHNASRDIPLVLGFYFGFGPLGFIGGYTFTSVLGIALSADAIVGEWKEKTLFLLFSKPVNRRAVLAGKVLGAYASVLLVLLVVFGTGLAILVGSLGVPNGESWGRILGALGLIAVALLPFVGLGIFCSTWFKTPASSFVVALALWLIGLPILGRGGELLLLMQGKADQISSSSLVQFFHYLDPMNLMQSATTILFRGTSELEFLRLFQGAPDEIPNVLLAVAIWTVVLLGASLALIGRRDYA